MSDYFLAFRWIRNLVEQLHWLGQSPLSSGFISAKAIWIAARLASVHFRIPDDLVFCLSDDQAIIYRRFHRYVLHVLDSESAKIFLLPSEIAAPLLDIQYLLTCSRTRRFLTNIYGTKIATHQLQSIHMVNIFVGSVICGYHWSQFGDSVQFLAFPHRIPISTFDYCKKRYRTNAWAPHAHSHPENMPAL